MTDQHQTPPLKIREAATDATEGVGKRADAVASTHSPCPDVPVVTGHDAGGQGHASHAHDHSHACGSTEWTDTPLDRTALVSMRDVGVTRGGRKILENIDYDVSPGEIVTVIGPNGAGKTTFVRALLRITPVETGTVAWRHGLTVGYVPQAFDRGFAVPITAKDFVALGQRGASAQAVMSSLDEVGAASAAGTQLSSLSGGEFQRVLLARALLRTPELLVLDEPVRGVDYMGEAALYELIARLRSDRGFAVVLVSHDLHVVMAASDRVICLNRHICCSGKPVTVAQHPEYERLFGAKAARAFALYEHHHDHTHKLSGEPVAGPGAEPSPDEAGPEGREHAGPAPLGTERSGPSRS